MILRDNFCYTSCFRVFNLLFRYWVTNSDSWLCCQMCSMERPNVSPTAWAKCVHVVLWSQGLWCRYIALLCTSTERTYIYVYTWHCIIVIHWQNHCSYFKISCEKLASTSSLYSELACLGTPEFNHWVYKQVITSSNQKVIG